MALVDHTFRFYEPEESHYQVIVPQFIKMNAPGLKVVMSDPESKIDLNKSPSNIVIQGMSAEAMTVQQSLMFVYADSFCSNMLATVQVEVHAR